MVEQQVWDIRLVAVAVVLLSLSSPSSPVKTDGMEVHPSVMVEVVDPQSSLKNTWNQNQNYKLFNV
jgi:hypothetical protein